MEVILSSITNSTSLKINIFEIEELMRKLATIRTIANIKPIPNADRIEVAQIDGWEVIISKSDNFSQGDKVVLRIHHQRYSQENQRIRHFYRRSERRFPDRRNDHPLPHRRPGCSGRSTFDSP